MQTSSGAMNTNTRDYFSAQRVLALAFVCLVYFAAGRLGLWVPFTSGNVSPVWPASGVGLAAALLLGSYAWFGIAMGAFLVNFLSPIPAVAATGIAIGNASGAIVGGYLLNRVAGFHHSLLRLKDVLTLIVFGAVASTLVAAIVGTTTLFLTHVRPWSDFGTALRVWWFGDAMGVLIVTPLLLTWHELEKPQVGPGRIELFILLLATACSAVTIFSQVMGFAVRDDVLAFAVFPSVIWAAIRFRIAGTSVTCFLIAAVAVWGTAQGFGPFVSHNPLHNALLLQLFLAVIAITGLLLAAVINERSQAEHALRRLSGRLLQLQDEERRRLARELHDSTGQGLVALQMNLAAIRQQGSLTDERTSQILFESGKQLEQLVQEIRTLSYLLHPPLLDEAGLESALGWYVDGLAQRAGMEIDFYFEPRLGRLSQELETAIFRIVQECLTNVQRHSGSSIASIHVARENDQLLITVRDEGKGVPSESLADANSTQCMVGVGIRGMRERVRELGGHFRIGPAFPGTIVEVALPYKQRHTDRAPENARARAQGK
jgi:two-component system, NarL family, sensor histidine kinase FusK